MGGKRVPEKNCLQCGILMTTGMPSLLRRKFCGNACVNAFRKTDEQVRKNFWAKVDMAGPCDCWPWKGARNVWGYGTFRFREHNTQAHRVSWFMQHGVMPALDLLHSCDNPRCVNPAHLRPGTDQDNMDEKMAKGRHRHGASPLSELLHPHLSRRVRHD